MKDEEIDAIGAGPKMDELVAVHVMGLKPPFAYADATAGGGHADPGGYRIGAKPYSTCLTPSWEVVEKMKTRYYQLEVRTPTGPGADARFSPLQPWTNAATLPLAICRAALKVVFKRAE